MQTKGFALPNGKHPDGLNKVANLEKVARQEHLERPRQHGEHHQEHGEHRQEHGERHQEHGERQKHGKEYR